jgi:hypothetical protein
MTHNSQITGGVENAVLSRRRYLSQLTVSLKNTGTTIFLALTAHQTPTFTGWHIDGFWVHNQIY